jgi:hypothetical protein
VLCALVTPSILTVNSFASLITLSSWITIVTLLSREQLIVSKLGSSE